jgi:hypothetical protein
MSVTWTQVPVAADPGDAAWAAQLIADVLGRAHRAAEAVDAPDEARAILAVAQSFADELAAMSPRFDRVAFIAACTPDMS